MNHAEMIKVIQAHSEGKAIEYDEDLIWKVTKNPKWNFERRNYRVKPDPIYRLVGDPTNIVGPKFVEIKALEDLFSLFNEPRKEWRAEDHANYQAIEELIK